MDHFDIRLKAPPKEFSNISLNMDKLLYEAQKDLDAQVDAYILSLFGGSLEKFIELAPLYILEEHPTNPVVFEPNNYTIRLERDVRLRPKRYDEI